MTAVAPVRLEPLIVRVKEDPWLPEVGEIDVIVGAWLWLTVKATAFDVPPGVVTDTWRAPVVAPDVMLIEAVTWVADDWMFDTVIPVDGEKLSAVVPVRLEPLIVRVKDDPGLP